MSRFYSDVLLKGMIDPLQASSTHDQWNQMDNHAVWFWLSRASVSLGFNCDTHFSLSTAQVLVIIARKVAAGRILIYLKVDGQ